MSSSTRRQFIQATAGSALLGSLGGFGAGSALAQSLDMIKIVNGFPAGGTADLTSRRVGDKLAAAGYGKSAVVENKTGAAGRIAVDTVKVAPADGSVLLLTPYSMMAIYPHIYKSLSYDPFKDFAPVCMGSMLSHGLAVGPLVPASVKNVKDFIAWAKANPKDASYGSPAAGSTPHFLGALMGINAGMEFKHVPYRGSVPGVADVVGGTLASMVTPHGDFIANHKAGRLRVLATSGKKRSPFLPDIPTFAEQGFPELTVEEWFGFYAPGKTPAATVQAANAAINAVVKQPATAEGLAVLGLLPVGGSVDDMVKDMQAQYEYWGPIVKKIGFSAES